MKTSTLYGQATGATVSTSVLLPRGKRIVGAQTSAYYNPTAPDTFFVELSTSGAPSSSSLGPLQPTNGDPSIILHYSRFILTGVGLIDLNEFIMNLDVRIAPNQAVWMHARGTVGLIVASIVVFYE